MARPQSIWRRPAGTGHWYTTKGKKKVIVADRSKTKKEAWEIYCANYTAPPPKQILVKLVLNRFLDHCQKNQAANTYKWYRRFLVSFSGRISDGLTVVRLKKYQVQEWLDYEDEWQDNTKNGAVRALKAALNWAADMELIEANPVARFKAPRRTGRELWLDDAEFKRLVGFIDDSFADYLTFGFETGARPQEIRILSARHFDGEKFTIGRKDAKGKKHARVIYCNERIQKLVKALAKLNPEGPLFTNQDGGAWTPNAVRSRFKRRAKKKGQPAIGLAIKMGMPGLCAYTMRHSFCTNALIRGLDVLTVAQLMGHQDATMVMRVYQHLAKNHAYLLKAANQATAANVPIAVQIAAGGFDTVPVVPV